MIRPPPRLPVDTVSGQQSYDTGQYVTGLRILFTIKVVKPLRHDPLSHTPVASKCTHYSVVCTINMKQFLKRVATRRVKWPVSR